MFLLTNLSYGLTKSLTLLPDISESPLNKSLAKAPDIWFGCDEDRINMFNPKKIN
jgi:hypothetical protein